MMRCKGLRLSCRGTRWRIPALLVCILIGQAEGNKPPKFALVLSGGGARGLSQIGVLKAFEERGIRPDVVVATSMGAIIGSLYACGYSAGEIRDIAAAIDWNDVYANTARRPGLLVSQKAEPVNYLLELRFDDNLRPELPNSISHGQQFFNNLAGLLSPFQFAAGADFDSLAVPLRIVTTDIVSGRAVVISHGNLAAAVRASCGVPLAFSPVAVDSMLMMDGGLTANIPVEPALDMGCGVVVAVDVSSPMWKRDDINNPVRLVDQIIAIGISKRKDDERKLAQLIIAPELTGKLNTDFSGIDSLIDIGYRSAVAMMPALDALIRPAAPDTAGPPAAGGCAVMTWRRDEPGFDAVLDSVLRPLSAAGRIDPHAVDSVVNRIRHGTGYAYCRVVAAAVHGDTLHAAVDPGRLSRIEVAGARTVSDRMLVSMLNLKPGALLDRGVVPRVIATLYATDLFNTVNADVDSVNVLRIHVSEKKHLRVRMGLRFDEYLLGEGYVQPAYENLFGLGIRGLLHLQYGLRREKYALEFQGNHQITPWWANTLQLQGYIARERIVEYSSEIDTTDTTDTRWLIHYYERSLRKAGILGMAGFQVGRIVMVNGGIRLERFRVFQSDNSVFEDLPGAFKQGMPFIMVGMTVDNLDRYPLPRRGHKHSLALGVASDVFGGTENFIKADGSLEYTFTVAKRHTFSPNVKFAWSSSVLPEVEKAYLGGIIPDEKYRSMGVFINVPFVGLPPRALPGDIMGILHLDYRVNIFRELYANALIDWGMAASKTEVPSLAGFFTMFPDSSPVGLGLGVTYNTFFGPVRLAWGRLLYRGLVPGDLETGNVFYFSVGHDF